MNCDCITTANEALKQFDIQIDVTFTMPNMKEYIRVPTVWAEGIRPKRGKRPKVILATFCPFCGVKTNSREQAREEGVK